MKRINIAAVSSRALKASVVVLLLLLALHCTRNVITREQWSSRTPEQKELIVQSLRGGETAAAAKGGVARPHSREVAYYRTEIDRRYASGDRRSVNEIWQELSDR